MSGLDDPIYTTPCPDCGAQPPTWTEFEEDLIPETVYKCDSCGGFAARRHAHIIGPDEYHPDEEFLISVEQVYITFNCYQTITGSLPDEDLVFKYLDGLSRYEAIDHEIVENYDISQKRWARARDVSQPAVAANVRRAREQLASVPDYE